MSNWFSKDLVLSSSTIDVLYLRLRLQDFFVHSQAKLELIYGVNVPGVYCYWNSAAIYIGESQHPFFRLTQHKNPKDVFPISNKEEILIYASEQFNKSVIRHIESELIQFADTYRALMAHKWLDLRNRHIPIDDRMNEGNYFMKDQYTGIAGEIWNHWNSTDVRLVQCDMGTILNSPRYRLSPNKLLNAEQLDVLKKITEEWQKHKLIIVKGMPGTGKSLLAFNLFSILNELNSVCLTSGTKATLSDFKRAAAKKNSSRKSKVLWKYDLLKEDHCPFDLVIVDEAHRLLKESIRGHPGGKGVSGKYTHIPEGSNEFEMLFRKCDHLILFYDENQVVHDGDFYAKSAFSKNDVLVLDISIQERLPRGGFSYVSRLFDFLDGKEVSDAYQSDYDLRFFDLFTVLHATLLDYSKKNTSEAPVALLSGYTRKWASKKNKLVFDFDDLSPIKLRWNDIKNRNKWLYSSAALNLGEVAYYTTVQGTDMSYAGVIVGRDLIWDPELEKLSADINYVVRDDRPDPSLPKDEFDAQLLLFVVNRYKILFTRATKGTFVYIENKELREKMKFVFNAIY